MFEDVNQAALDKEVSIKFTLRELLQITALCHEFKEPGNQCKAIEGKITARFQALPAKVQNAFNCWVEGMTNELDRRDWPENLED